MEFKLEMHVRLTDGTTYELEEIRKQSDEYIFGLKHGVVGCQNDSWFCLTKQECIEYVEDGRMTILSW